MTTPSANPPASGVQPLTPALTAATSFAVADILAQMTMRSGADVLTTVVLRGVAGMALLYGWLRFGVRLPPITPRARLISQGVGLLFAGNVYALFVAIDRLPIAIAILTYFTYPLLTGLAAGLTGVEKITWRGIAAAVAALLGLALMIGAHPVGLSVVGIVAGLTASSFRVTMLLITRATLANAHPLQITWHSFVSSTLVLALIALASWNFHAPQTLVGWLSLAGLSIGTTIAVLAVFISIGRVGPFRTALFMNLEPLLAAILGVIVLGEVLTPLQMFGGAVMIVALVMFQIRK